MEKHTSIQLAADGSATRTTEIRGSGLASVAVRTFLDSIGPGKEADWARNNLAGAGLRGTAALNALAADEMQGLGYRYTEQISNFISQPEASSIYFNAGIGGPINSQNILHRFTESQRKSDFKCDAFLIEDNVEIALAPELQVLFVPQDVHLKEHAVFFDARYQRHGNTYSVQRRWGLASDTAWCAAGDYADFKKSMNQIQKALNGRLLFMNRNAARHDL